MKLDFRDLSAVVRETFPPPPPLAGWLGFYYDSGDEAGEFAGWYCSSQVHSTQEDALCDLAGYRPFEGSAVVEVGRALFAKPESEAKVCPNCGKLTDKPHWARVDPDGEYLMWCCTRSEPTQPEHAAPGGESRDGTPASRLEDLLIDFWQEASRLSNDDRGDEVRDLTEKTAQAMLRTHAQPMGMTKELEHVLTIAGDHSFGKKTRDAITAVRSQCGRKP